MVNGLTTHLGLKLSFYNHFANRFSAPDWARAPFEGQFLNQLDIKQSSDLETEVTNEEIKRAVWDCGYDKSSGQMALLPFLTNVTPHSLHQSQSQGQSAFMKGRQIMEGPLILVLIDRGMFVPITVEKDNLVPILHLFYANDAMFIRKWSSSNVSVLMLMVHCFFLVSGLKGNVHKSSLYGVGVRPSDIQHMASCFGCLANNLPFIYLGIKVGANMSRVNSWNEVVLKSITKLKAKGMDLMEFCNLVIGNGNTLKLWLDKWCGDACFKEKFHRLYNLETNKIKTVACKFQTSDFSSSFRRRSRSGVEESQFLELSRLLSSVLLSSTCDRWSWSLNWLGNFSGKSAREFIDSHVLVTSSSPTRWSKVLPIKLNVFLWRMFLDKFPTMENLFNIGLDIPSALCPFCDIGVETRDHLCFGSSLPSDLFRLLGRW
nr:RNA-directed DNA polymerase, eukaryota, reverse transcriptase zinc-binding domain protein [Tanacetum cinerariifolium]